MNYADIFNEVVSYMTLALILGLIAIPVLHAFALLAFDRVWSFLERYAIELAGSLGVLSTLGALFYSNVIGYPACSLCLIQRIFMFPIPVVLWVGFMRRDWSRIALKTALVLAALGLVAAGYHLTKDMLTLYSPSTATLGCPEIKGVPSCERIYFNYFGFVTIPTVALAAFAWIATLCVAGIRKK